MKRIIILFFIFFFGLVCGYLYGSKIRGGISLPQQYNVSRSSSNDAKLTDPLIDCEQYEQPSLVASNTLRNKVEAVVDRNQTDSSSIAVYFRNLRNGPWFGINEKEQFDPASLLKVPVLIAYLKKAETHPELLSNTFVYKGANSNKTLANLPKELELIRGEKYTVDTLLKNMISYSDNSSFQLLVDGIEPEYVIKIHKELDIPYPDKNTPENYISVRNYAGLFRILYNATYLSRDMSEKALSYLVNSHFNQGIRSGIPANMTAALKFGIRTYPTNNKIAQLHECGIVYKDNDPYILCIMTKNRPLQDSLKILKEISRVVFQGVSLSQ